MPDKNPDNETATWSLRDIYFIFFLHKKKIFIVTVVVMAVAALYVFFGIQKTYSSEAQLLVKIGRESTAMDPTVATGEITVRRPRVEEIRTEIGIMKSPEIAKRVVDDIGLENFMKLIGQGSMEKAFEDKPIQKVYKKIRKILKLPIKKPDPEARKKTLREGLAKAIVGSLQVRPQRYSSIIYVVFTARTPKLAHDVLEKIINIYLERHVEIFFTDSSYSFLNQQTEFFRSELEETEQEIRDFKNRSGFTALQEENLILLERISIERQAIKEAESTIAASEVKVNMLNEKLKNLQKTLGDEGTNLLSGSGVEEVERRLSVLRLQEQELLSTFTEESIPVQEIRRQIREVQAMLAGQPETPQSSRVPLSIRDQIQSDLLSEESNIIVLKAKLKFLREQLNSSQKELRELNESIPILAKLERKKEKEESGYKKFSESLEQARIDQALKMEKISNISLVQPATFPTRPNPGKRKFILLAGILGGVVCGLGLGFLLENLDHTIKKPEDVKRKLNLHSLVSIPKVKIKSVLKPDFNTVDNLILVPKPTHASDEMIASAQKARKEIRKYFEILMHRVIFSDKGYFEGTYVFAFTSSRLGEGVSTVASNFAFNIARVGRGRILFVDMNLIKFSREDNSEEGPFPNLGNMIAVRKGNPTENLPSRVDKLYMLQHSNQGKSTGLEDLQSLWRKEYEFVIMDLPPVLDDPRVPTLARLADEVILVVEAERERMEVIKSTQEILAEAKANLTGIILNKRNFYIPKWLYKTL